MWRIQFVVVLIFSLAFLSEFAQISIGQNDPNLAEKKKIYCSMISYHFLDDHNSVFESFTQGMNALKTELFKNKVARRLSQNCQQKITNQQLLELSRLLENLSGHQKQLFDIENKYVEYFTPQNGIVLKMLQQVQKQSDLEVSKELQKFHQARKSIEQNTRIIVKGFKQIQRHIDEKGRFIVNTMNQMSSLVADIHAAVMDAVSKIKNDPDIKKIKEFFDQL